MWCARRTFKERSQFYAALQDTMALHFREYGRLEPTYQACLDLIAQKRRDILLRPPPVAGAAVPDATRVAGSQDDAKKGQKRGQSEAGAKTAPPGAKPTFKPHVGFSHVRRFTFHFAYINRGRRSH